MANHRPSRSSAGKSPFSVAKPMAPKRDPLAFIKSKELKAQAAASGPQNRSSDCWITHLFAHGRAAPLPRALSFARASAYLPASNRSLALQIFGTGSTSTGCLSAAPRRWPNAPSIFSNFGSEAPRSLVCHPNPGSGKYLGTSSSPAAASTTRALRSPCEGADCQGTCRCLRLAQATWGERKFLASPSSACSWLRLRTGVLC